MISMPQIQSIRSRRRNGESIASIARSERVSEPTVRKYLRVDDLSARPPVRRRRGSVIDEWLPMIEGMLAEDRETVLLQCLFDRFGSVFPQCGLMVFPGVVIVSR